MLEKKRTMNPLVPWSDDLFEKYYDICEELGRRVLFPFLSYIRYTAFRHLCARTVCGANLFFS